MRALLEKGNFLQVMRYAADAAKDLALECAKIGLRACRGMDIIIGGFGGLFSGLALAEKLNVPMLQAHYGIVRFLLPILQGTAAGQCSRFVRML